jgi:hypothetical protein
MQSVQFIVRLIPIADMAYFLHGPTAAANNLGLTSLLEFKLPYSI